MSYEVLLHPDVDEFLRSLDEKSERICRDNLAYLEENPYPGRGQGDKEGLVIDGDDRYRQHISHEYTVFYDIYEERNEVRVTEILPIDDAHKRYGY
ncbi:type II toxin-antitoxin system RelE family toxin [Halocatena salina]|uniref:Type II toxin-antitoxin system RelE/ParE family toxin n=1 Tax=Halocatena salina TaxID=2934340 RepID=A0A8U0A6W9_9EURY|nr:type II toxin-antitoxin system RelE/ParE family toxin [Halocatena salina]UPM44852.1 type II toxin-antitoxin system RelE/ParE family toxin [Halocatena salina]